MISVSFVLIVLLVYVLQEKRDEVLSIFFSMTGRVSSLYEKVRVKILDESQMVLNRLIQMLSMANLRKEQD
mgnify:CR=1 FL=1